MDAFLASLPAQVDAWVWLGIGYLLGSIPFGLLLTRAAGLGDIRTIGSGNIGATNVLRTGHKGLAAATLLLDAAKGASAVLLAGHFETNAAVLAGAGAFLGHLFPVWLGFRGGKGVATFLGVVAALSAWVGLGFAAVWLVTAALFRYSSLAAIIAAIACPVIAALLGRLDVTALAAVMAVMILFKHEANIKRLVAGSEPKIGQKQAP
jgi:acyl phosphate:glycerol-3-phosphate acyltransferase